MRSYKEGDRFRDVNDTPYIESTGIRRAKVCMLRAEKSFALTAAM